MLTTLLAPLAALSLAVSAPQQAGTALDIEPDRARCFYVSSPTEVAQDNEGVADDPTILADCAAHQLPVGEPEPELAEAGAAW